MKKTLSKRAGLISTLMGAGVAIANGWANVDWVNFDWHKAWPTLAVSGMIALGGYMTKVKVKE